MRHDRPQEPREGHRPEVTMPALNADASFDENEIQVSDFEEEINVNELERQSDATAA